MFSHETGAVTQLQEATEKKKHRKRQTILVMDTDTDIHLIYNM